MQDSLGALRKLCCQLQICARYYVSAFTRVYTRDADLILGKLTLVITRRRVRVRQDRNTGKFNTTVSLSCYCSFGSTVRYGFRFTIIKSFVQTRESCAFVVCILQDISVKFIMFYALMSPLRCAGLAFFKKNSHFQV